MLLPLTLRPSQPTSTSPPNARASLAIEWQGRACRPRALTITARPRAACDSCTGNFLLVARRQARRPGAARPGRGGSAGHFAQQVDQLLARARRQREAAEVLGARQ